MIRGQGTTPRGEKHRSQLAAHAIVHIAHQALALLSERALAIGLANRVVPKAELLSAGEALAAEILGKASSESIARTKRLLLALPGLPLDERLGAAAEANAAARATADCRRGISTFLAEKKTPDWRSA